MADLPRNPVPVENYPSASQDGQAIPLAAIRPVGSYIGEATGGTLVTVPLPEDINLVSILCTARGRLILPGSTTSGAYQSNTFVFMPDVMYELVLPNSVQLRLEDDGEIIINVLMKWGQMRNIGSYYVS